MAIIKRIRKSGIKYQVKFRGIDNRWLTRTFDSWREAERFELETKTGIGQGGVVTSERTKLTLDEFFDHWFENAPHCAAPGWRKTQSQIYNTFVSPFLGKAKLVEINPVMAGEVLRSRALTQRSEATALLFPGTKMFRTKNLSMANKG